MFNTIFAFIFDVCCVVLFDQKYILLTFSFYSASELLTLIFNQIILISADFKENKSLKNVKKAIIFLILIDFFFFFFFYYVMDVTITNSVLR